jgi:hypothetical protein
LADQYVPFIAGATVGIETSWQTLAYGSSSFFPATRAKRTVQIRDSIDSFIKIQ